MSYLLEGIAGGDSGNNTGCLTFWKALLAVTPVIIPEVLIYGDYLLEGITGGNSGNDTGGLLTGDILNKNINVNTLFNQDIL